MMAQAVDTKGMPSRRMIRYALKCSDGHRFDSWFQSAAAYDGLATAGHLACAICGTPAVDKDLMAPKRGPGTEPASDRPLSRPASPAEQALSDLRRRIETESTDVGDRFAAEARSMHEGAIPRRAIHGEARIADAKKLIEDGVPVAPLPFRPRRQTN